MGWKLGTELRQGPMGSRTTCDPGGHGCSWLPRAGVVAAGGRVTAISASHQGGAEAGEREGAGIRAPETLLRGLTPRPGRLWSAAVGAALPLVSQEDGCGWRLGRQLSVQHVFTGGWWHGQVHPQAVFSLDGWGTDSSEGQSSSEHHGACKRGRWLQPHSGHGAAGSGCLYPSSPGLQLPPQRALPPGQQSPKASWEQIPE